MTVDFNSGSVNSNFQPPEKKEEGVLKGMWNTFFTSKVEKQVEGLNNSLVNHVWKQVKHKEVDEKEINFLLILKDTLGEVDFSDKEIKDLHQFIYQNKENVENLQKYIEEVSRIQNKNINNIQKGEPLIFSGSPQTKEWKGLVQPALNLLNQNNLQKLGSRLSESALLSHEQVITDIVKKLDNPLVNHVWSQVEHEEINEKEISLLLNLQNTLGKIDFSDEEVKSLHQFIHQDKESIEDLRKYINMMSFIRKENMELFKEGKPLILSGSPQAKEWKQFIKPVFTLLNQHNLQKLSSRLSESALLSRQQAIIDTLDRSKNPLVEHVLNLVSHDEIDKTELDILTSLQDILGEIDLNDEEVKSLHQFIHQDKESIEDLRKYINMMSFIRKENMELFKEGKPLILSGSPQAQEWKQLIKPVFTLLNQHSLQELSSRLSESALLSRQQVIIDTLDRSKNPLVEHVLSVINPDEIDKTELDILTSLQDTLGEVPLSNEEVKNLHQLIHQDKENVEGLRKYINKMSLIRKENMELFKEGKPLILRGSPQAKGWKKLIKPVFTLLRQHNLKELSSRLSESALLSRQQVIIDTLDRPKNPLVEHVLSVINPDEIDKTELDILTNLQDILGEVPLSNEEVKSLHQFIHQDKENIESFQKYVDEVSQIRRKNIQFLKSGNPLIPFDSQEAQQVMGLIAEVTMPLMGLNLNNLMFPLLDRVFSTNSQVISDTMILAVDRDSSLGTVNRHRGIVSSLNKNIGNYTPDQQTLIQKGFITRSDNLNGIWQKTDWVREKGKDLEDGKAVFEKGYMDIILAIPGKDYVKVQTHLDLAPLGNLNDDQNILVFEAIANFGKSSTESALQEINKERDKFSFLSKKQFETLIDIAKNFSEDSVNQLTTALVAVGSMDQDIPKVTRLQVESILISIGLPMKEEERNELEQVLRTVSSDKGTLDLVESFIDDCNHLRGNKSDRLLKQAIIKMGLITERASEKRLNSKTIKSLSAFLQEVIQSVAGK